MQIDGFNNSIISFEQAIDKITLNTDRSYQWFAVKNSKKCLFELGGRNYKGILEIKASIPNYTSKGKICTYSNTFIDHKFDVDLYGVYFPDKTLDYSFESNYKLMEYLNKTDFRIRSPRITEKEVMIPEIQYSVKL